MSHNHNQQYSQHNQQRGHSGHMYKTQQSAGQPTSSAGPNDGASARHRQHTNAMPQNHGDSFGNSWPSGSAASAGSNRIVHTQIPQHQQPLPTKHYQQYSSSSGASQRLQQQKANVPIQANHGSSSNMNQMSGGGRKGEMPVSIQKYQQQMHGQQLKESLNSNGSKNTNTGLHLKNGGAQSHSSQHYQGKASASNKQSSFVLQQSQIIPSQVGVPIASSTRNQKSKAAPFANDMGFKEFGLASSAMVSKKSHASASSSRNQHHQKGQDTQPLLTQSHQMAKASYNGANGYSNIMQGQYGSVPVRASVNGKQANTNLSRQNSSSNATEKPGKAHTQRSSERLQVTKQTKQGSSPRRAQDPNFSGQVNIKQLIKAKANQEKVSQAKLTQLDLINSMALTAVAQLNEDQQRHRLFREQQQLRENERERQQLGNSSGTTGKSNLKRSMKVGASANPTSGKSTATRLVTDNNESAQTLTKPSQRSSATAIGRKSYRNQENSMPAGSQNHTKIMQNCQNQQTVSKVSIINAPPSNQFNQTYTSKPAEKKVPVRNTAQHEQTLQISQGRTSTSTINTSQTNLRSKYQQSRQPSSKGQSASNNGRASGTGSHGATGQLKPGNTHQQYQQKVQYRSNGQVSQKKAVRSSSKKSFSNTSQNQNFAMTTTGTGYGTTHQGIVVQQPTQSSLTPRNGTNTSTGGSRAQSGTARSSVSLAKHGAKGQQNTQRRSTLSKPKDSTSKKPAAEDRQTLTTVTDLSGTNGYHAFNSNPTAAQLPQTATAKSSNQFLTNSSSSNQKQNTLNEYRQYMEKQKQMLRQLSSNKLSHVLNAINTDQEAPQKQDDDERVINQAASSKVLKTMRNSAATNEYCDQDTRKSQRQLIQTSSQLQLMQQQQRVQREDAARKSRVSQPGPQQQMSFAQKELSTTAAAASFGPGDFQNQKRSQPRLEQVQPIPQKQVLTPRMLSSSKKEEKPSTSTEPQTKKQDSTQKSNNIPRQSHRGGEPQDRCECTESYTCKVHQVEKKVTTTDAEVKKQEAPPAAAAADEKPKELDDSMVFSDRKNLDDYIIGKQIGQGAYAVVRVGLHKPSNKKIAMKIYKKYKLMDPNRRKSVKREIKLMEKMRNSQIIALYEVIDTSKYVILIMEYVGGGSLHGYLKSHANRRLEENEARRIFKQVVEGIRYCHNRCITHRDIKLENLLLDDKRNIKIIDFGFSTCIPNDKRIKIFCGTPSYMGPEIVNKTEYCGPPADIWALGVLLFTILSGCFPYRGATDKELYDKISRAAYRLPSEVANSLSPDALDLLNSLFQLNADERPTAKQILSHSWLKDVVLPPPSSSLHFNPVAASLAKQEKKQEQLQSSQLMIQKGQSAPGHLEDAQVKQTVARQSNSQKPNLQIQLTKRSSDPQYGQQHQPQSSSMVDQQNIMSSGNVINNNFNIINNYVGVQNPTSSNEITSADSQILPKSSGSNPRSQTNPPSTRGSASTAYQTQAQQQSHNPLSNQPSNTLRSNKDVKEEHIQPSYNTHTNQSAYGKAEYQHRHGGTMVQQVVQGQRESSANSAISGFSAISGGLSAFSNDINLTKQNGQAKANNWLEKSQTLLQQHANQNAANKYNQETSRFNEKIIQMIVQKLGYSEDEVKTYVSTDKNSFVGVLYHKLLDDQNEKQALIDRHNQQQMQQLQHMQQQQYNDAQSLSTSEHNISAKLPIQPSFVPSFGCLSQINDAGAGQASTSKLSLNNTTSNLNLDEKSRENLVLGLTQGSGLNLSATMGGTMNNTSALNLSHSLLNNSQLNATTTHQQPQTMSLNNINFYPQQNNVGQQHQGNDFSVSPTHHLTGPNQQHQYIPRDHHQHNQFAQSMKNVSQPQQRVDQCANFGIPMQHTQDFAQQQQQSNSLIGSSFLQGFTARRGFNDQNLQLQAPSNCSLPIQNHKGSMPQTQTHQKLARDLDMLLLPDDQAMQILPTGKVATSSKNKQSSYTNMMQQKAQQQHQNPMHHQMQQNLHSSAQQSPMLFNSRRQHHQHEDQKHTDAQNLHPNFDNTLQLLGKNMYARGHSAASQGKHTHHKQQNEHQDVKNGNQLFYPVQQYRE